MTSKRSTWPVEDFPYMVERDYASGPQYYRSLDAAKARLVGLVKDFAHDMKHLAPEIGDQAETVIRAIETIGADGGRVDLVLAPYTGTRFKATVTRRFEVKPR